MTSEENRLIRDLVETVKAISDRQDSFQKAVEDRFLSGLQRLEVENDFLRDLVKHFVGLLDILEKLIHKIRTAYMESRIWEQVEEYRENDGKKKHRSKRTPGFDVERKPRRPAE